MRSSLLTPPLIPVKTIPSSERRERPPERWPLAIIAGVALLALIIFEVRSSRLQAILLTAIGQRMAFTLTEGAGGETVPAGDGPYDRRLGYSALPEILARLQASGFVLERKAEASPMLRMARGAGIYPIYSEKTQAGLQVLDRSGQILYAKAYPERIYRDFASVPSVVTNTLLFVENREVLETNTPYRNPALEWSRLGKAIFDVTLHRINPSHPLSGGSTLATQLEKIRHSPNGRTDSSREKLRQILTASLRSYQNGEDTLEARRKIVCEYLNSLPLSAAAGYGEVLGLGDGLWAWYGADFDEVNRLLRNPEKSLSDPQLADKTALAYRQVLGLILAVNKPSLYLREDYSRLNERVDSYLRLMSDAGLLPTQLRDACLRVRPQLLNAAPAVPAPPLPERKTNEPIRARLLNTLGMSSSYELDRMDLEAYSTLDEGLTRGAAQSLYELTAKNTAAEAGLTGERLLSSADKAQSVIYSFTLFERGPESNYLRAQVDNFSGELNINEGTKLELGSTAKLRTLATYLEVMAELHAKYGNRSPAELQSIPAEQRDDHLTSWAIEYLSATPDRSLPAMLEAAMMRTYSASSGEAFFTGGGLHVFSNFEPKDNGRKMTVREAFQRSVNLVFIRMMRDLVHHSIRQVQSEYSRILADPTHPLRSVYLERFADTEGREFLSRFYRKYRGLNSDEVLNGLLQGKSHAPFRLAVIYRSIRPEATFEMFSNFMRSQPQGKALKDQEIESLYIKYAPEGFNLQDRGYLAHVHPLELWLAAYLHRHPKANFEEITQASRRQRQEVYRWLLRPNRKRGQDVRIRTLIEADTFKVIHKYWQKQRYPFPSLVPSYATALGSSGDTPAALAELAGIIMNDGLYRPSQRLERLHFARGTPMETVLVKRPAPPERVLHPAVASTLRAEMLGVVEKGTARRAYGSVVLSDGRRVDIGGKTGTGDNRIGKAKVVNRTGTFVFTLGDRFFGTVVAYVPGPEAASYSFTSSLPVQVFRHLIPNVLPLLEDRVQLTRR